MAAIKEPSVFSVSILFPSSFCFILSVLLVLFLTSSQAVAYYVYLQDAVYFRADNNNRKIYMYSVEHESKWATEEFPADQVPTSLASLIHFLTRPLANSLQRGLSSTNRSRISPLARLYQPHSQESTVIMDFQDSNIESGIAFSVYGMDNEGRRLSFGFATMHRHMLNITNLAQHYNGVNEISNVPTFNIFSVMARGDVMRRIVRLIQNPNDNSISSYTLSIPRHLPVDLQNYYDSLTETSYGTSLVRGTHLNYHEFNMRGIGSRLPQQESVLLTISLLNPTEIAAYRSQNPPEVTDCHCDTSAEKNASF